MPRRSSEICMKIALSKAFQITFMVSQYVGLVEMVLGSSLASGVSFSDSGTGGKLKELRHVQSFYLTKLKVEIKLHILSTARSVCRTIDFSLVNCRSRPWSIKAHMYSHVSRPDSLVLRMPSTSTTQSLAKPGLNRVGLRCQEIFSSNLAFTAFLFCCRKVLLQHGIFRHPAH